MFDVFASSLDETFCRFVLCFHLCVLVTDWKSLLREVKTPYLHIHSRPPLHPRTSLAFKACFKLPAAFTWTQAAKASLGRH